MNEKQFLKVLNDKSNSHGTYTYAQVYRLLVTRENKPKLSTKISTILRYFNKFIKIKTQKQIIEDNFEHIMSRTNNSEIGRLLILLMEDDEMKDIVYEKFLEVMKRFKEGDKYTCFNYSSIDSLFVQQSEFFEALREMFDGEILIQDNIDIILESIPNKNLFRIAQTIKDISEEIDCKINQRLEENKVEVAESILDVYTRKRTFDIDSEPLDPTLVPKYATTLSIMIDELLQSENCRMVDIKGLGGGSYSYVYQIGSKVLKVGIPRETYKIPNHTRILQPLTRTNFINEKDDSTFACIEIADKVDIVDRSGITEEKLYEVYKDLRDCGIIWTDVRGVNVGKLINKNNQYQMLNNEIIDVEPNSVGFIDEIQGEERKQGDLVILDTDYIYNSDDSNIQWPSLGLATKFEKRWQQEQQVKIAQEHENNRVEESENERREENEKQQKV